MAYTFTKSVTSRSGIVQNIYTGHGVILVVYKDRGALIVGSKGVKKVTVSVQGNSATVAEEVSGFLSAGNLAQGWVNRME